MQALGSCLLPVQPFGDYQIPDVILPRRLLLLLLPLDSCLRGLAAWPVPSVRFLSSYHISCCLLGHRFVRSACGYPYFWVINMYERRRKSFLVVADVSVSVVPDLTHRCFCSDVPRQDLSLVVCTSVKSDRTC